MLKQWCSTCSPTVRLVGIYCQLNLLQEPHPGNGREKQMNEPHCHGERAGEEPLQLPPITIQNPSNSSAEGNKHKIFLAKAIQPCPRASSPVSCGKGEQEVDLPFHCLLRSGWRRRGSRAGIPLILLLSTEMQALCFPVLWDCSAHLTDWKGWPPNWREVLNM